MVTSSSSARALLSRLAQAFTPNTFDAVPRSQGRRVVRSSAPRLAGLAPWLMLTGLVGTVPLPALAAPQAVGPPITVYNQLANLALPAEQASVDARANGDFAVAWIDDAGAVRVQRYGANGVAQTAALVAVVGSLGVFRNGQPDVAMGEDGSMVVVWEQGTAIGFVSDVYYRRVLPSGALSGLAPVRVNATGLANIGVNQNVRPAVAAGVDGRFVVTWQSTVQGTSVSRIRARRFTVSGNAVQGAGAVFQAGSVGGQQQAAPDVAMDAHGAYAIVWEDRTGDFAAIGLQRFDASGLAIGSALSLAPFAPRIGMPAVAVNPAGDSLLLAYREIANDGSSQSAVVGVRLALDLSGASNFYVSDAPGRVQFIRASVDAAGRFAVLWGERSPVLNNVSPKALLRRFDTSGTPLDAPSFVVEADDLAMDADSDLVTVSSRRIGQSLQVVSASYQNVIAQRFQGVEPVDLTVTHQFQSNSPSDHPSLIRYKVLVSNLHSPVALGVAPTVQTAIGAASEVMVVTGNGFAAGSGAGWTCVGPGGQQRCSYGPSLAPGQTAADLFVVQLGAYATPPAIRSTVSANQLDPNLTNNTVQTLVPGPQ